MSFLLQLLLILFLIFLNGFFVASEFSLVSIRRTRIAELVKKGRKRAKLVHKALKDLDNYISSTQLGITFSSLALGWIGEPALAAFLEPFLKFLPHTAAVVTANTAAVIIAFIVITFLHIVLGELSPKSIALQQTEKTLLLVIGPLYVFTKLFQPFIWVLNQSGLLVTKALGFQGIKPGQLVHSEEEIKIILTQSQEGGAIAKDEARMLYNVFRMSDLTVKQIMVPRTEIIAFSETRVIKDLLKDIENYPYFSRFPIYRGTVDTVIGFIHLKDLYKIPQKSENLTVKQAKIIRDILFVPEIKKVDEVFLQMRLKRIHIAIVNDEFGGTDGVVTMEDIIESLVGEIEDEFDRPQVEIQKQSGGSYLVDGRTNIEKIRNKFKLSIKGQGYTTIGGLIFGLIGREPRPGEKIYLGNLLFIVEKVEKKQIKLLRIQHLSPDKNPV